MQNPDDGGVAVRGPRPHAHVVAFVGEHVADNPRRPAGVLGDVGLQDHAVDVRHDQAEPCEHDFNHCHCHISTFAVAEVTLHLGAVVIVERVQPLPHNVNRLRCTSQHQTARGQGCRKCRYAHTCVS